MYTLLIILIVIAAILMVGIVLIQESKGGGLASNFASYNQIGGVRKTTDFIEKATWSLAAFMVIVSVACAFAVPKAASSDSVVESIDVAPAANANNIPGFAAGDANEAADAAAADAAAATDAAADAAAATGKE